jgi:2-aminoadipate transaminase
MTITETQFAHRVSSIPESFIREILKVAANPNVISFAGGLPNPAFFPVAKIAAAAEKVLSKDGSVVLQYAPTEGYLPLRDYIASRESKKSGRKISAEDVLMLNGSQQGLDLMGKIFLNPGTDLLLEAPSYLGAIQAFSAYQPRFREIRMEEGGPSTEHLEHNLKNHDAAFFYCIPNFQNPTGNTYDLAHRTDIVSRLEDSNALVLEDNPYGDIYFDKTDLPDLAQLMPSRTVQLGSFSKIISPGLRLGWVIAPESILKKLIIVKQASDLHSSNLGQRILYQFLLDNSLDDHLSGIRDFYKQQALVMSTLMKRYFTNDVTWTQPNGGMFIWITLPENMDANTLLNRAIEQNVIFVPGQNFFVNPSEGKNTIRMNFSNPTIAQMERGISIMAKLMNDG